MEWKLTHQGTYGASINAFQQVVVKIWTSRNFDANILSIGFVLNFDL